MITVTLNNFRREWTAGIFPDLGSAMRYLFTNGIVSPNTRRVFDGTYLTFDIVNGIEARVNYFPE